MNFRRNLISNVIFQIINICIAFVTSVIVARGLGPERQGQAAFFLLILNTICEFAHLGINNSTIYFLKKSKYDEKTVLGTNFVFLVLNSLTLVLILISLRVLGYIFSSYSILVCIIGFTSITFWYLRVMASNLYTAKEEIYKINKYLLLFKIAKILSILIIFIVDKFDIEIYLIIMSLFSILEGLILFLSVKKSYEFLYKINFRFLIEELKFAIKMILAYLFIYINYKLDQILIREMLGDYYLGLYSVAVYLAELLFLVPTCIGTALIGKISNIEGEFKDIIIKTIKVTFNLCIILSLIGILCTYLIPILYGKEYSDIKITIIILFIGIIFASIGKIGYLFFTMNNNPGIYMYITLATMIINVVGNVILIPKTGINGAAIASSISYAFFGIVHVVIFKYKENIRVRDILFINRKDIYIIKQYIYKLKFLSGKFKK